MVTEEGITWECARCGNQNALELGTCAVCGAAFAETIDPEPERAQRDPGTAALLSLFLPGAGHAYLGLWGQGIARAILTLWCFLVLATSFVERGTAGAGVVAAGFGIVIVGLWIVSSHDAYREAQRRSKEVLLKPRIFVYLVLALLFFLFVLLFAAGFQARA